MKEVIIMDEHKKNDNKSCRSMTFRTGNTKIEVTADLITIFVKNN